MANDDMNPDLPEPDAFTPQPVVLVSSVLHLMSHYTANRDEPGAGARLAPAIAHHLQALARLPDLAPVLRATCQQLSEQWSMIVTQATPQPERRSFLTRLLSGVYGERN